MISINITIDESTLNELVILYLTKQLGERKFDAKNITIWVKSKQNYKSEWEQAAFKATYIEASSI